MDQFNSDYIESQIQSVVDEVKRHPGIIAGAVAVLAGVGLAALFLNQRSGPTRLERFRGALNPKDWIDTDRLRGRWDGFAGSVADTLSDLNDQAHDFGDEARHRSRRWFNEARHSSRKAAKKGGRQARRYASDAGQFAKDHAKEGGAILALATIAAAVAAAAIEARRPDSKIRSLGRF